MKVKSYILYRYATLLAKKAEPVPLRESEEMVLGVLYLGEKTFVDLCCIIVSFERSSILKACLSLMENGLIEREPVSMSGFRTHLYRITNRGILFEQHMQERTKHYIELFASQFKENL